MEEVYLRGLFQNILENRFKNKNGSNSNGSLIAVIITSVVFGLGHILSSMGQGPLIVFLKIIWAIALGIYFGAVYKNKKFMGSNYPSFYNKSMWTPILFFNN